MLQVKEIWGPTIQGEGAQAGWPAVFIRFAGCNMWNGKAETKARSMCPYCDTDFEGGTPMNHVDVLRTVADLIPHGKRFLVVLTGGEPLLQDSDELELLVKDLHKMGHKVQIETNGTLSSPVLAAIDFVTVSPKLPLRKLKVPWFYVDTLKLLHPHPTVDYREFLDGALVDNSGGPMNYYIQPIEEGTVMQARANVQAAIALVKELGFPWRLSLQTHKIIGER